MVKDNFAMLTFFSKLSLSNNTEKPPIEVGQPAYMDKSATLQELGYKDENDLKETIYGLFCCNPSDFTTYVLGF